MILKELISSGKLNTVLDPSITKEDITDFIINYSPALFAFEVEVLQYPEPVCVVFYNASDTQFISDLKQMVTQNASLAQFKWVYIDNHKLFSLIQECQIPQVPALLIFKDRQEIANYIPITNIYECENIIKTIHL